MFCIVVFLHIFRDGNLNASQRSDGKMHKNYPQSDEKMNKNVYFLYLFDIVAGGGMHAMQCFASLFFSHFSRWKFKCKAT